MTHNSSNNYDPFVQHPIPTAIGLFLLAFVIVTLNLVAIVVFVKKQRTKPPVDYPLLSLLFANMLQGTVTLPAYALKKINAWGAEEQAYICDLYRYSYFLCAHASILSLLASSFDRLIALVYSLSYWQIVTKRRIMITLICIWCGVIAFDALPLLPTYSKSHSCHYVPTKAWSVSMHVIMNIIPLPILLANYIVTIRIAFKHTKRTQLDLNCSKLGRRDKLNMLYNMRATRKVLLIIGSYFLCVGPACIYYLLEWLCRSCYTKEYKEHREQYVRFVMKVLVKFNAVISPVLFFWKSKVFRKSVREVFSTKDPFSTGKRDFNSFSENQRFVIKNRDSPADSPELPLKSLDSPASSMAGTPKKNFKRRLLSRIKGNKGNKDLLLRSTDSEENGNAVKTEHGGTVIDETAT